MRIIVTGGTGFLGHPLCRSLAEDGHDVVVLSRKGPAGGASASKPGGGAGVRVVGWTGDASTAGWGRLVDGAGAVVNLAGESIAGRRWTDEQKSRLERSRLETTRAVFEAIGAAGQPPRVLVSGSAVGYYGPRGDEVLTEASAPGEDFLSRLAVRWEAEASKAASSRTRVVLLRTGIVLGRDGGALAKMLLPFKLGLGGPLGSGRQFMSWIHRADWVAMVRWALDADVSGPLNGTAPMPVTNADFTRALGAALGRPAVLPAPAFALRLMLGEMADPLLLTGQRVVPERARAQGFTFRHGTLPEALADVVRR
jgi:uncharacterized protein (TIGR01777 family)